MSAICIASANRAPNKLFIALQVNTLLRNVVLSSKQSHVCYSQIPLTKRSFDQGSSREGEREGAICITFHVHLRSGNPVLKNGPDRNVPFIEFCIILRVFSLCAKISSNRSERIFNPTGLNAPMSFFATELQWHTCGS